MEDYKEKYEKLHRFVNDLYPHMSDYCKEKVEGYFPELKESEDERIRKKIINFLSTPFVKKGMSEGALSTWIAWLKKQGEQKTVSKTEPIVEGLTTEFQKQVSHLIASAMNKEHEYTKVYVEWVAQSLLGYAKNEHTPTNKVEPKFKVGDWIVNTITKETEQVIELTDCEYICSGHLIVSFSNQHLLKRWTIQDATDGDVLYHKSQSGIEYIVMSSGVNEFGNVDSYFRYNSVDGFGISVPSVFSTKVDNITPATKEQRILLFSKMKEAGYEWDAEKKELKKIEQKPEIKDDVLSRFSFYQFAFDQYYDDTIYLSSLYVRESNRGHGYGSKVLKAAEEVAKTFGVSKIRLKVERNTWMEEWYKKNGYEYLSSEGKYDWLENKVMDIKPDKIEKNPAWSKEDENILNEFIESLRYCNGNGYNKQIDWLKSIKERVQPQSRQEWSEKEKARIDKIIDVLDWAEEKCYIRYSDWEDYVCYVKSIRPHNTWKPSDEQIGVIAKIINSNTLDAYTLGILQHFYQDLIKLKEE